MPYTNYGLFKATRSHQITSPQVRSIRHKSRPNACNLCHLDRTLTWTADHLTDWYGQPGADLKEDEQTVAAWVLWALRGDAGQRVIAAWHARWEDAVQASGDAWLVSVLTRLRNDPYAAVRYVADVSLKKLPSSNQSVTLETVLGLGTGSDAGDTHAVLDAILSKQDQTPIASVE